MASLEATLEVAGQRYPLVHATFGVSQPVGRRGRAATKVRYSVVELALNVPTDDRLLAWANDPTQRQAASLTFSDATTGNALETLSLGAAYCVGYREEFASGAAGRGSYYCTLVLSDPDGFTMQAGGPSGAFVAPAARAHGVPGAATVVAGTELVLRLPRIIGDPPFVVKGAERGKPALDRTEYLRQLTGQQNGLNRLTVAEFLANRDAYNNRKKTRRDGRDPASSKFQDLARERAREDKIEELLTADDNLSEADARAQADAWLDTQTALHDPDQIAGGHGHLIAGMGDARINSSIGGAWPKRIKGIDKQVRAYAATMTPEQQATTYLNVVLPLA